MKILIFVSHSVLMRLIVFSIFILGIGCSESIETRKQRFLIRGNESFAKKNYEEAGHFYREAVRLDSCFADAWNNLGTLSYSQNKYAASVIEYSQALECNPDFFDALLNRANANYMAGNNDAARRDVSRLLEIRKDTAIVYFISGLLNARMAAFEAAEADFMNVLGLDPGHQEALVNLATVKYYQENFNATDSLLNMVDASDLRSSVLNLKAMVAAGRGNFVDAIGYLEEALAAEPNNPSLINNRGYMHLMQGDLGKAAADIDKSIALDAMNGWAYRNKGLYFLKSGDYTQAIRLFDRATRAVEYVEALYVSFGDAYEAAGNMEKACETWRKEPVQQKVEGRLKKCR